MFWIVQKNFIRNERDDLVNTLSRLDINYVEVNVDKNEIDIEVDSNQPIMTNGSIMLSNIARKKNWTPGGFLNDNFSYPKWSHYYHDFLLNKNATVYKLKDTVMLEEKAFIRPILDNKSFNGRVFEKYQFLEFQKKSDHLDIDIILSLPKKIGQEHRHYIVDGKIITSSRYKLAGTPNFSEGADDRVLEVVDKAIKIWQPARAFVLDTYIAGDEIGIVEIGGICHAGFYKADLMSLVNALDSMDYNPKKSLKF